MPVKAMNTRKVSANDLLMLLVVAFWALNLSLVKVALREIPPWPGSHLRAA